MRIHELKTTARPNRVRPGRGISAGRGKTAGRGTKGQNSRTGGGVRPGFEGGQNPLTARIPKLAGFTSRRPKSQTITVSVLARVSSKSIDNQVLFAAGVIAQPHRPVKVVLGGELKTAKTVKLAAASSGAIKLIETAGGSFTPSPVPHKVSSKGQAKS